MMRRSGSSPAVKLSKLGCVMPRRAASGHIPATQFGKFAAASRIADAVIRGWPGAPSSPLHGGAAPAGPGVACVAGADFCPENRLPRKLETPLVPEDWAKALPDSAGSKSSSAAATIIAPVRLFIADAVQPMSCLSAAGTGFRRPCHGFQQLNKGQILSFPPASARGGTSITSTHPPLFPAANRLPTCDQRIFSFLVFKARPSP